MANSPIQHKEPITGSLYWPYWETNMSSFGYYLWWAFCFQKSLAVEANKLMKISIEGFVKVFIAFIFAIITGWVILWVVFWIMLFSVVGAHIWLFFNPPPTRESKIKALRDLLKEE